MRLAPVLLFALAASCATGETELPLDGIDDSFLDVTGAKLRHTIDRQAVCRTCNLDPINKLTEAIKHAEGGVDDPAVVTLAEGLRQGSRAIADALTTMFPQTPDILAERPRRPMIPLVVER